MEELISGSDFYVESVFQMSSFFIFLKLPVRRTLVFEPRKTQEKSKSVAEVTKAELSGVLYRTVPC